MKKILYTLAILGLCIVGYFFSNYHAKEYIHENLVLSNNIRTLGVMTQDDVDLLSQIDSAFLSGVDLRGGLFFKSAVSLEKDSRGYSFINNDAMQKLFVRVKAQPIWRIENPFSMNCEGPGCPMPWWLNTLNMIIHDVKPIKITDIVIVQPDEQIILQGTGGSRITQVKRGP